MAVLNSIQYIIKCVSPICQSFCQTLQNTEEHHNAICWSDTWGASQVTAETSAPPAWRAGSDPRKTQTPPDHYAADIISEGTYPPVLSWASAGRVPLHTRQPESKVYPEAFVGIGHVCYQMIPIIYYPLNTAFLKTTSGVGIGGRRYIPKAGDGEGPPITQLQLKGNWRSCPLGDLHQHHPSFES